MRAARRLATGRDGNEFRDLRRRRQQQKYQQARPPRVQPARHPCVRRVGRHHEPQPGEPQDVQEQPQDQNGDEGDVKEPVHDPEGMEEG